MDSEDDFNSLASGSEMDFDDDQDSSVDFGGGMLHSRPNACATCL